MAATPNARLRALGWRRVQGVAGSTEWAEEHAEELQRKAVGYLNTDSYSAGRLSAGGSHTLTTFVRQVARNAWIPPVGAARPMRLLRTS